MPRGSRHKSTRHGSRDARESSDSENDSSLKDRKGKESGSRVLKDSASSEKRRLDSRDSKDFYASENHEKVERGFSKRRKERYDDGTTDRWNGGSDDDLGDRSKKSKASADSKSKRRDETVGLQCDGEELKKSSGKSEGRHRESSRKEGRNGGVERERKVREGRSDKVVVSEDLRLEKQVEKNAENLLPSPEPEMRSRRGAGSFDGDKHKDDIGDVENRQLSSKNDALKDGRRRNKHRDERNEEKYWEDPDRDVKHKDERLVKDHTIRSNDREMRDEKDAKDIQHKKNRSQVTDPNQELSKTRVHESDLDSVRDQDHDRDRYHAYERVHDQESRRGRDRERDRGHDRDGNRNRSHSRAHDHHYDYECDFDRDGSHIEDQYTKYLDSRRRKRSPNSHDDSRSKSSKKSHHSTEEKKPLSNDKVESDAERGKSQSRSHHADVNLSSHRRKSSPSSMSRVGMDEYRHLDQEDSRERYPKKEERSKSISTRDQSIFSGVQEKGAKYTFVEKPHETDGGNATELSRERSLNSKTIDIEESGRRRNTSVDAKDPSSNKDRQSRDLSGEKPPVDESYRAESSFYSKPSQSNPSSFHPRATFRAGVDVSFDGSVEDDSRLNSNSRFRRSNDPNLGRLHGNTWRGVPNWTAPLPNGFIPFQHGPPHGGFQSIMPQFPAPPLFGIRPPPLEINHSGVPYRMPDAERFSGHLHPLGWQNMLDGSSPSHLHGWDGNNGVFRDESQIYSGGEWDENRQMVNGRGWESRADMWKRQGGSLKREIPSQFQKDDHAVQDPVDNVSCREVCDESSNCDLTRTAEMRPSILSAKESPRTPELISETPAPLRHSMDDNSKLSSVYLSKLEISAELANPDLYHQCRRLMDIEDCAIPDEETAVFIILEGGARAVTASSNSAHPSHFHPIQNSIFQRAMDLYKKQRVERKEMQLVSGGKLDGSLVSSEGRLGERCQKLHDEITVPISTVAVEMTHIPISSIDDKEVVPATSALEKLEDSVSTAGQEVKCLENLEESLPVSGSTEVDAIASSEQQEVKCLENLEESLPVSGSTQVDAMASSEQQVDLGVERDTIIPSDGVFVATDTSSDVVDVKGSAYGDDSTRCGIENPCFDKAVSDPLSFSDEMPNACDGLMPVSNGSESLILSRIHHSPESTH